MLYGPGPEKISQTRINTYSTSGRYGKSSSHARTRVAWIVWIEVVATATIMSPVSIAAHNGVRIPSVRPAPQVSFRPANRCCNDETGRSWQRDHSISIC